MNVAVNYYLVEILVYVLVVIQLEWMDKMTNKDLTAWVKHECPDCGSNLDLYITFNLSDVNLTKGYMLKDEEDEDD